MGIYHDDEGDELAAGQIIDIHAAKPNGLWAHVVWYDGHHIVIGRGDGERNELLSAEIMCNEDIAKRLAHALMREFAAIDRLFPALAAAAKGPVCQHCGDKGGVSECNACGLCAGCGHYHGHADDCPLAPSFPFAKSNKAPNTLSDAVPHLCAPSAADGQPTPGEDTP